MTSYVGSVGLWIAAPASDAEPPLPPISSDVAHGHDYCAAILVDELGSRPPGDLRRGLRAFAGERRVEQVIRAHPRRLATA